MYYPREDSYLLEKHVKRLAIGSVLDMGTGTGIQALAAANSKRVRKVLAVDIDKGSIEYCKKNSRHKKIKYKLSDLFSKIPKQRFDTIIFNPPYLPQEQSRRNISIEGGKKGYEVIQKFIDKTSAYLKSNGNILLLFSSLTNRKMVEEFLHNKMLDFKMIDSIHYFFEELYVYNIIKSPLLRVLEKKGVKDIDYLAKGKRGVVYTGKYRKKKIAIKTKRKESEAVGRIKNEIKYLKILNKHRIGPKLVMHNKNWLAYEFVPGEFIRDWIPKAKKKDLKRVFKNVFNKCFKMDQLGINKEEMHHPVKHVIIGKSVKLIDFERARKTKDPKNVSQFCQFVMSLKPVLEKKGFKINKNEIISSAKEYKQDFKTQRFKKVLKTIGL
ncbi:methyltransferase [Candidatus Woesearchaeota archaeon]|nr:methyltransferase [Candidatus Woesearchaeota archaeon]MBW3005968.1 methyltransferase [Candidatus Woesearchaeota archaeon]